MWTVSGAVATITCLRAKRSTVWLRCFSAVGWPSLKESYSNPPCSPPLDPPFQVASGASISSTSMYLDECDLMNLKI